MATRDDIINYCNELLNVASFQDYCPNGLQVEGRSQVDTLITGVTASQALVDAAVETRADMLMVHHGYFWKGEDPVISGMKRQRLATLLQNDLSLVAYHLPLDGHEQLGNNAMLAQIMGIHIEGRFGQGPDGGIGMYGRFDKPVEAHLLVEHVEQILDRKPLYIEGGSATIESIAWCSGGAASYMDQAAKLGVDAFLTGEPSEPSFHIASELGIHFFAAGHHATERYGIQALGEHLAEYFGLTHKFIDIDNPI